MDADAALWKTADVAAYLRISEAAVRELAEGTAGLPHLSLAGHLRFRKADIEAWLDLQMSGSPAAPAPPTPRQTPPPPTAEVTDLICGYRVRVEYRPLTGDPHRARRAIAAVVARNILRRRGEAETGNA